MIQTTHLYLLTKPSRSIRNHWHRFMALMAAYHWPPSNQFRPPDFHQSVQALLLSTLAINVLSLALPVMTLQVYDRILPNPDSGTLPVLIAGVCVAIVLETVLRLSRSYVITRAGAAYEHRMACLVIQKMLRADLAQMGSLGIGEHLHRIGAVSKLRDFYNGYAFTTLAELVFVPLFLLLIYYISGPLVAVPLLVLAGFVATSLWQGRRLKSALENREEADEQRFNFLVEALDGIHTVKSFALEKFFARRYEALEEESTLTNYRVTQETSGTFNNGAIFSHIMVASVIGIGAWCVLQGLLTTGGLIATLLLAGRIIQPIQKALALWARYQDYLLACRHMETVLNTPQRNSDIYLPSQLPTPQGTLKLHHIAFCQNEGEYCSLHGPQLHDINLMLAPGEATLLTGGHGEGKTTLLNIIAGIYPPGDGVVEIDGLPVSHFPPEQLVHHVGYIRTRPVMFRGTIRDNITSFGQVKESIAREVASLLRVDHSVAQLPGGFDTFLNGSDADSITPGLKQRIAMVRALATKPKLILFDNADHGLDREGYTAIYQLLARLKGKATLLIVSDDYNIRALADSRHHLHGGTLQRRHNPLHKANIHLFRELRP